MSKKHECSALTKPAAWFCGFLLAALIAASPAAGAGSLVGLAGKCADVEGGDPSDGTPVNLYECHGGANQLWEFVPSSPSYFEVRGLDGMCLQPGDIHSTFGPRLVVGPCGGLEDRWDPDPDFLSGSLLVHVSSGLCMDVEESGTADGNPIILFACNRTPNQLWTFEEEDPPPPSGDYLLGFHGKCAEIAGSPGEDDTLVNLSTCLRGDNQRWDFVESDLYYEVRSVAGKCLQPGDMQSEFGPRLAIGPCGGLEARWDPHAGSLDEFSYGFPYEFLLMHVSSGLCMDVERSRSEDGSPIILFDCNRQPNQVWTLTDHFEPICLPSATNLCLNHRRFHVMVEWRDFQGNTGRGRVVDSGSDDSGLFWFFDEENWEMLVKVLRGCGFNNHYWVFAAATTNVGYTLRITDIRTGAVREYTNPLGTNAAAIADIEAFAGCP